MDNQALFDQASDQSLAQLVAGNQRFVSGKSIHPNQNSDHRVALRQEQRPFAAILGCADSRVPPSIIFDQGLGDLFVIRVAGNIVDSSVLSSIEFAVLQLQVSLIVVLCHANCGAVSATVDGKSLPGHLPHIAQAIQPALELVKHQPGDLVDNTIRSNAKLVKNQLGNSEPVLAPRLGSGQLKIMAAYYDLESGQVEFLSNTKGCTDDEQRRESEIKTSV